MSRSAINSAILPEILERVKHARRVIMEEKDYLEGAIIMDDIRRMLDAHGYTRENRPSTFQLIDLITTEIDKKLF